MMSAVTGDNLPLLHHFLSRLQPALSKEERADAQQGTCTLFVMFQIVVTKVNRILFLVQEESADSGPV